MKRTLLSTLLVSSTILFTACDDRPALSQSASVTLPEAPVPATLAEAAPVPNEATELAQQIEELKAQEAELRLQMQQDELAREKADLDRQRDDLARDKAALEAAASTPADAPSGKPAVDVADVASVRRATPVDKEALAVTPGGHDYQMFYESLSPYGQWFETSEYGYVWQPADSASNWRPYTRGRWADSDQGWTWISDEPHGWATYHYGRWALLEGRGWIWVPGDTWAPAWVSWRNNNDLVGWSPLPPETTYVDDAGYGPDIDESYGISPDVYTFMPVQHFDEPVYEHCYPVTQNRNFFSLTVGITRIVIRSGNVHCDGPERRWVNGRLSRPMTRYRLDRDHDWNDRRDYRPRFDNDRLNCYAPRVRTPWNEALRPARLGGRIDSVKVVRRHEVVRGESSRRFQEEQRQRRDRANEVIRQEPIKRLVARHGDLEKIRAQRVQLSQRSEVANRLRGDGKRGEEGTRSDKSDLTRGEGARQNALRNEKVESARRELQQRQEEIAKLRQQRESSRDNQGGGRGADGRVSPDRNNKEQDGRRNEEVARENKDARERQERVEKEARDATNRRGQAAANEAENKQREELRKRQEEVARLRQQRDEQEKNRGRNEVTRGNQDRTPGRGSDSNNRIESEARDAANRRAQAQAEENRKRQDDENRNRQNESAQRGQRDNLANKEREESARREQARAAEAQQRAAEQAQRGQRESQATKEREESVRREEARAAEARQRAAEQAQRGQRESQARQAREEANRREQARQNESRQRQAAEQERNNRNREQAENARREQSRQNESRQRQAEQERRSREDSQRQNQAREAEQRQREANDRRRSESSRSNNDNKNDDEKKRRGR